MPITKKFVPPVALILVLTAVLAIAVIYSARKHFPIVQETRFESGYGDITFARPLITSRALVVVFADTRKFHADELAPHIAKAGAAVAVVDSGQALEKFSTGENHCLNPSRIREPLEILAQWAHAGKNTRSILAGIGNGGLLPFLSAGTLSGAASRNLSAGFTATLPDGVRVCPPLITKSVQGKEVLTSAPALQSKWLSVWTDQPDDATAILVRGISDAGTAIAPYNTPLDTVLVGELRKILAEDTTKQSPFNTIVEVPAKTPNETVTFLYSGDGGWRDLDRDVAGEMATRGYPVVGVDTLRAFWRAKTPEETAGELTELMAYYRKTWKAKNFILAGYSFGADILPSVYNRLPEPDRQSVAMLVLLALGKTADFEIHVSGWIGKSNDGLPLLPELNKIPGNKVLCIYGQEEKTDSACADLSTSGARRMELPGGHHFDHNYPKLAGQIIDIYHQEGQNRGN